MGRQSTEAMLEVASREQGLSWHLFSNHYPPPPREMLAVASKAIDRVNAGETTQIRLPRGITYRGAALIDPWAVVESFHLEPFIDDCEEW